MNVLLRFLKVISISVLFVLNENLDFLQRDFYIPKHFSGGIIGFLLFLFIAELGRDILTFLYRRRKKMSPRETDNVVVGLANIYFLIIAGSVVYFILYLLKMKPVEFFTGISLISAAIAVTMKDYIANIISGMILAFSDKLKIGDYVQIGKHIGEIIDFSLTMITLRNDDEELVYIPSNTIYLHDLINYSAIGEDAFIISFEINNKMKIPYEEIESKLKTVLSGYSEHLMNREIGHLFIDRSGQESTTFKYRYVLKNKDIPLNREIKKAMLKVVYDNTNIISINPIT